MYRSPWRFTIYNLQFTVIYNKNDLKALNSMECYYTINIINSINDLQFFQTTIIEMIMIKSNDERNIKPVDKKRK